MNICLLIQSQIKSTSESITFTNFYLFIFNLHVLCNSGKKIHMTLGRTITKIKQKTIPQTFFHISVHNSEINIKGIQINTQNLSLKDKVGFITKCF